MATPPEIKHFVIDRMDLLARPRWDPERDPQRFLQLVAEYGKILRGYSTATLQAGMDLWSLNWTKSSWPMPAELVGFMNRAQADSAPPALPDRSREPRARTPVEIAAYRKETEQIVARTRGRLAWLDNHPETSGAFKTDNPMQNRFSEEER